MTDDASNIIKAAITGVGLENYSMKDLAEAKNASGDTGLDLAACNRHLDKIQGGITAEQLAQVRTKHNLTPLHIAAGYGALHQIKGGVTAAQLIAAKGDHGETALENAACYGWMEQDQIKDGVTLEQLAQTRNGLFLAADGASLDQIIGGVTAAQILQYGGPELMRRIIEAGALHQLKSGVTFAELKHIAFPGKLQPDALSLMDWLIQISGAGDGSVQRIVSFLVGCPQAARLLKTDRPHHIKALRLAMPRNAKISDFVAPEMTATMFSAL